MFDLADHLNISPPWCDIIISCIQSVTDLINNTLHVLIPVDRCGSMQLSLEKASAAYNHVKIGISQSKHENLILKEVMIGDRFYSIINTVSLLKKGY